MKRILLLLAVLLCLSSLFAQEGTKQLMPNSGDRLYLEFGTFTGNNFGYFGSGPNERINIYLRAGEKLYFGMKMVTNNYGGNVFINPDRVKYKVLDPDGLIVQSNNAIPSAGTGYIGTYAQAVTGPNGAILNGTTITGGYTPIIITAAKTGNYYIEFQPWEKQGQSENPIRARFALEHFDVTVTNSSNNIITNPGEPNKSAGRLWSYAWGLTNTSFFSYPVNAHFFVVTSDWFINKINFKMYPYSFVFVANQFGITPYTEDNYVKRTQSQMGDQVSGKNISEYRIFLNDPDRTVWPNVILTPPKVQVWAEEELFMDYNYNRDPLYLDINYSSVVLEKNRHDCDFEDVTFFKIESSLDGYSVVLIDVDGDGEYSSNGSDRVIYRPLKRGLNYVLWNFKTDAGADVAPGTYNASATFLGRGPAHFPIYDVEQLDGITTSSIRPFNKLNTTIYWDDSQIARWGDETGAGLMNDTKKKQLRVENHVPRLWSYNPALQNVSHNGEVNTMNTWFNAIDLGYTSINIVVQQSESKCVDGSAPWVGDLYIEGPKNQVINFNLDDFKLKFFHPNGNALSSIRVVTLPSSGILRLSGTPITAGQEISAANINNITFTPPVDYHGKTSFIWKAFDGYIWSNNQENVYLIINTPPTISAIADQKLCTNTPTEAIPFTVGDAETNPNDLIVTGFSAFPEFVPHSGIVIGGSGANRTVTVTPVANKSGRAIIYLMVDDGLSQALVEFAVTVSPSLEFSGSTILCVGDPLYLVAEEFGADSYSWKFGETVVSTSRILEQSHPVSMGEWSLTITKTVEGEVCTSTRYFNVEVAPLTTFSGDLSVCVGQTISLNATEVNAIYSWRKGGVEISNLKTFTKTAALVDNASNYTLFVTKYGCSNESAPFAIVVEQLPNQGLAVTGSTVDPGKNGTITINNAQTGVTYLIYKGTTFVASANGTGVNLPITIPSSFLTIGSNEFIIKANNGSCEAELTNKGYVVVNQPGVTVTPLTLTTYEDGAPVTFSIVLKTEPSLDVSIAVSSSNTNEGTVSPASVTFTPANWNTPKIITVTPVRDWIVDINQVYTIIVHPATGTDPYYAGINPDDVVVTNVNADVANVVVSKTALYTSENGDSDAFTLVLTSKPSSNVVVTFSGIDSNEGSINPLSVTFTPENWDSPQIVTVTGVNDDADDDDVTYTIYLSAASGDINYNGVSINSILVTNYDNDTAGITVSPSSVTTFEAGGFTSFTVVLDTKPFSNIALSIVSSDTSEGTVSPSAITFTVDNWNTPRTITVTGVDDNVVDGNVNYQINLTVTSGDIKYTGKTAVVNAINVDDDVAGIWTSKLSITTAEPSVSDNFQVRLTSQPTSNVVLSVVSSNTNEGTVSLANLTFTPANWNVNQLVTVTGVDDNFVDGNIPYTVTMSVVSGDAVYNTVSSAVVNAINNDDDTAGIWVSKSAITTTEAGGSESFGVKLTSQPYHTVTISITGLNTSEGSLNKATLTFEPSEWNVEQTVTVTGVDDPEQDGNITYTLYLSSTSTDTYYNITNGAQVAVTNVDNDEAGITVSPRTLTINEGQNSTFSISVNTQPAEGKTVTVSFVSPNPAEVTVSPSSAVFTNASWAPVQITVSAINDEIDDDNQSYIINLGSATSDDSNYHGLSAGIVTVNVTDIHTAGITVSSPSGNTTEAGGTATFTVVLNTKPVNNVVITSTSQDPIEGTVQGSPLTFTSLNWNTPQTVTVKGVDDFVDDGDKSYDVLVAVSSTDPKYTSSLNKTVTLINVDDDTAGVTVNPTSGLQTTEAGGTAKFTVVLNSEPTHDVSITLVSSDTSEGTVVPTPIVFTSSNWSTPREITLTGVDDFIADGDQAYTINLSAASSDAKYHNIAITSVSAINIDNDVAGVILSPLTDATNRLITTEDLGTATYTVRLNSQPTSSVTISSTSDDATEGTVISGGTLVFSTANWDTPQTVTVRGVNDFVADGNQPYTVTLTATSSDTKYSGIPINKVFLLNEDNDVVGLIVSKASIQTSEPNINDNFTVKLQSQPIADVVVSISSSDETEGVISPSTSTLTFTTVNWNTPQTVTVLAQDDNRVDGDIAYNITLSTTSATDPLYNALANVIIPAVNLDNDIAGIIVNPVAGLFTTEAGGTATFTIVLRSEPANSVSIRLSSSVVTEGVVSAVTRGTVNQIGNEAFVTFLPSEWNSPVTVTVTGVDDDYDDGDKAYSIFTHPAVSVDPLYNDRNAQDVSLTNRDNDTWGITVEPTTINLDEDGVAKTYTVVLRSRPTHDVTIPISSAQPSRATVSPSSIVFQTASATDWKTPKTLTVTPVNNLIADGFAQFFIINGNIVSDDVNYKNNKPVDVEILLTDDDVAGINVSTITNNTTEFGTTATFTISLNSEPTSLVTITMSSSDISEGIISAISRGTLDIPANSAEVTFNNTNWNSPVTITVTGVDDDLVDGNQTYYIEFGNSLSDDLTYNNVAIPSVQIVNEDDDSAGVSVFPVSGLVTNEAGQTAQFSVRLNTIPSHDVIIGIASSNVNEGTVSPSSLTFNASNWSTTQSVTITGVDDLIGDGNKLYSINLVIAETDDENYKVLTLPSVSVTNNDDLTPRPVNDLATTNQVNPVVINVLQNDLGLDYGAVVSIITQPLHGTVVANTDNTITYTPNRYYHGDFTFTYRVRNTLNNFANANVTVTVTRVDVTPIANDDFRGTSMNTPVEVDVLFNDANLYDIPITVSIIGSANPSGTMNVVANKVIFTPSADYVGLATFTYRITDNDGDWDEALVSINVRELNHNPVANDDIVTVLKNTPKDINVLANDIGLEDGFGSITIFTSPVNGTLLVNENRTITYTPNTDFIGSDSFVYLLKDVDGDYDLATVSISVVNKPNAIPVANPVSVATEMNIETIIDVLFNDTGLEDGVASVNLASTPVNGTAFVNPDFTITYTPNDGFIGTEAFSYQVCDVDGDCSNSALITVIVKPTGTNHLPVAVNDEATTYVNIQVAIDVLSNDTGLEDGFDKLVIHSLPKFGSVVINANNTITYTPSYMFIGNDSFEYRVHDVDGDWDKATVNIIVIERPNAIPVANNVSVATSFNTARTIDVLHNDTGLEDTPITVSIRTAPTALHGTAVVNPDNTVTFTPAADYIGLATFEYTVTDADGDSDFATVTVNVKEGENFIPVANDDEATTQVNRALEIDVLSNDTGLDDGFGSLTIQTAPQFGTAVVTTSRTILYTPSNMFVGTVTFTYKLADVDGDFDFATVTVHVEERANAIPVANNVSVATSFNTARTIDVLHNDTGLEDTPITVSIRTAPTALQGTAVVNPDNTVTFTPAAGYIGLATFEYTVTDADGDSDFATVTVNVKEGENFIPVANDDEATTQVNRALEIDVLSNDTGLDDGFGSLTIQAAPQFGTAVVTASRTILYTPSNMFVGTVAFTYKLADVDGDFDFATVTVHVEERANAIPVANNVSVATSFNTARTIDVLHNDTGLEDTPITVSIRTAPIALHGTAVVNPDNTVTFTPAAGYIGLATFEYTVTDADGDSDFATVTVNVKEGENFIPVANDDEATTQVNRAIDIAVLSNDTGLEDGFGSLTIQTAPQFGTAVVTASRTILYTPSNMFVGTVTFTYKLADVDGDFDFATVTVHVEERANAIPVANNVSVATSFNTARTIDVLHNDTGLEDTPITVSIRTAPTALHGTAVVNPDNTVTFTPAAGYIGLATFEYTVTDADGDSDFATVTVNVKEGENFIPVANDDDAITYVNVPVAIEVLANDTGLEDGFGSLEIFKYPAFGSVVVNDNNTITYTPSNYFVGTVTFMYKLYDVDGDFDVATVTVRVFDANNPKPIAVDDLLGTSFNTPVTINVLANDLGLDDAPITVTVLSEPDSNKGTAVVNQDNTIHFVPATNYVGEVIFTYLVTDANGDFDDATVTVTVKDGANHIPIANDDRRGTSLNTSVDIDVLENDLGLEDIPIVVTISQIPDPLKGTAIANADNSVTFTPANSFVGEATFMYTVTDAEGDHDSALVTVTVKATENNEPIATDDLVTTHREVPVNIYVLSNDTGLEDTPLTLTIVNEVNPSIGTVQIVGNTYIRFTPAQGYLGVTTFSYRVEDVDGDYDIATVTVTVISTLIAVNDNVEVKRNESIIIDILANDMGISDITPEVTLIYHPTQGTAVINPDNTVTYTPDLDYFGADELTYRVCSQYGQCSEAVVSIDVKIDKFRIPEGFSPDGDGINDRFEIIGIEIFNQVKIRIYNRWGNLVYQSERYQNDWDGKSNASMAIGSTLPTGTYYYTIEIVDTKEKFSGNVFLKR